VNRDFNTDLQKELLDPEFAVHFANAQAESAQELLKAGVINKLDATSLSNKTTKSYYTLIKERRHK